MRHEFNITYNGYEFTCHDREIDEDLLLQIQENDPDVDFYYLDRDSVCEFVYNDRCYVCPHGRSLQDVRREWMEQLAPDSPERVDLFNQLTDEQFLRVLEDAYVDACDPYSVGVFSKEYLDVLDMLTNGELAGKIDTIIDFGASDALQSLLFDEYQYIAVDDFFNAVVPHEGFESYVMSAQDFIFERLDEFDQDTTLALCFHVPDAEARAMVEDSFENAIVIWNGK